MLFHPASKQARPPEQLSGRYQSSGTDALANGWAGSMDVVMVWAWMQWKRWVGSTDVIMIWARMHWPMDALHGRCHGLGMDALANAWVGSW